MILSTQVAKGPPERDSRTQERLEVLVPPELLAGSVTARGTAERRPGPAALTAGHVRHVVTLQARSHIAPQVSERAICPLASDNTPVFSGTLAGVAYPV